MFGRYGFRSESLVLRIWLITDYTWNQSIIIPGQPFVGRVESPAVAVFCLHVYSEDS